MSQTLEIKEKFSNLAKSLVRGAVLGQIGQTLVSVTPVDIGGGSHALPMIQSIVDDWYLLSGDRTEDHKFGSVDNLDSKQKIIKVFQILHSERANPKKRPLNDNEFRILRRAIGNYNYRKAMELLFAVWSESKSGKGKQDVEKAAAILGSLKKTREDYRWFKDQLEMKKDVFV